MVGLKRPAEASSSRSSLIRVVSRDSKSVALVVSRRRQVPFAIQETLHAGVGDDLADEPVMTAAAGDWPTAMDPLAFWRSFVMVGSIKNQRISVSNCSREPTQR